MGTKERLAKGLEKLAGLVPGIKSYQEKEGLRENDKKLRDTLANRLDAARKAVEKVIDDLQRNGRLTHLDRLGQLDRKIHQAADAIRFAARGYSGVFDTVQIDEEKLADLYAYDISLAKSVSALQEAAEALKTTSAETFGEDDLKPLQVQLCSFNEKVKQREGWFGQT